MKGWFDLSEKDRREIIIQTSVDIGLPPAAVEKDYKEMQESMFYGKTETFENLINKLSQLNRRINSLQ